MTPEALTAARVDANRLATITGRPVGIWEDEDGRLYINHSSMWLAPIGVRGCTPQLVEVVGLTDRKKTA